MSESELAYTLIGDPDSETYKLVAALLERTATMTDDELLLALSHKEES